MTYNGRVYVLDQNAVIKEIVSKPVMRVVVLAETCAGYYVSAQELITGRRHDFLDGKPLEIAEGSFRARGDSDLVEYMPYVGHCYTVRGDHMDMTRQTATFDDQPATRLSLDDYEVSFADDLTSVTVEKK